MFKGIFDGDGIEVAVQVLNLQNKEHQRASWQNVKAFRKHSTSQSSEDHNFMLKC